MTVTLTALVSHVISMTNLSVTSLPVWTSSLVACSDHTWVVVAGHYHCISQKCLYFWHLSTGHMSMLHKGCAVPGIIWTGEAGQWSWTRSTPSFPDFFPWKEGNIPISYIQWILEGEVQHIAFLFNGRILRLANLLRSHRAYLNCFLSCHSCIFGIWGKWCFFWKMHLPSWEGGCLSFSETMDERMWTAMFSTHVMLHSFVSPVPEPVILPEILVKSSSITPSWCNVTLECKTPGNREDLNVTWQSEGLPRELVWSETPELAPNTWQLTMNSPLSQPNASLTCVVSNYVDKKTVSVDFEQVCSHGECNLPEGRDTPGVQVYWGESSGLFSPLCY